MKLRVASVVAAIMLALPVCAQHGAARGGFSAHSGFAGHGGFSGHAGFTGHSGFTGARGISRSAPFSGHSAFGRPVLARPGAPGLAGPRVPIRGSGFAPRRPQYRSPYGDRSGRRDRDRDRDRDRHRDHDRGRDRWLAGWYGNRYPFWLGYPYPYTINPGLYDWGDSGDSGYGQDLAPPQNYADANPYPGENAGPEPMQESTYSQPPATGAQTPRPAYTGISTSAPETEPAITVIFKNGRSPLTIQNYLMNSRTLTDLDRQHYEQIALDQIDIAATQQTNRSRGFEFQVPAASAE